MPALGQTPSPLYDISFSSKIGWGLFTGWLSKLSRKKVFKAAWSLGLKRPCYPSDAFCLKMEVTRSIQSQGWGKQTSFTDGKICSVTLQQGMSIRKGKEYLYPFFFFFLLFVTGFRMGEGNGNPLQYSCLESPMDGGAWWAAVHGIAKSRTRLSDFPSLSEWEEREETEIGCYLPNSHVI